MAIDRGLVPLLMQEAKERSFSGKILQLGRQEINFNEDYLVSMAKKMNFNLHETNAEPLIPSKYLHDKLVITDTYFFKRLGASEVYSLDGSDFEEADFIHDLNLIPPPEELKGQFDLIINWGTMEHIFHLPNVLANIFDMLKLGGRIIHFAPANSYEHGFYSFSPSFFNQYYLKNKFILNQSLLYRGTSTNRASYSEFTECGPGSAAIHYPGIGSLDSKIYLVFFVAEKTQDSRKDLIPTQGFYEAEWGISPSQNDGLATRFPGLKSIYRKLILLPLIGQSIEKLRIILPHRFLIPWRRIP
jgi:SAM-dependent methyltransferase